MMWVMLALVAIEISVVHLLVAFWNPLAALLLSLLSLSAVVWLTLLIRSFRARPVMLADGQLVWPCGALRVVTVPVSAIAGLRPEWNAALLKERATFNAALLAYPNVVIELTGPVMLGKRPIQRLAHKLDEPGPFIAALNAIGSEAGGMRGHG